MFGALIFRKSCAGFLRWWVTKPGRLDTLVTVTLYTCALTHLHTNIHTYVYTYMHIYTYRHTHIHICIHTYIHVYIHEYVRTYDIHSSRRNQSNILQVSNSNAFHFLSAFNVVSNCMFITTKHVLNVSSLGKVPNTLLLLLLLLLQNHHQGRQDTSWRL
jgi:hypothetical protein